MRNKSVRMLTQAGIIASLYVVLTLFANAMGLANYAVQLRFSEALCILPAFTFAAVPGLSVGCLIANLLTGAPIWDILFGSLATLLGAMGTYALRKYRFWMTLPPVLANAVIVPLTLRYGYGFEWIYQGRDLSLPYFFLTVSIGEILSVMLLGSLLYKLLLPYKGMIFQQK